MTFRAIVYAAVSTEDQATEDKASLTAQLTACRQVCADRGWPVVREIVLPGQSRSYTWLHTLVADSPEYAQLVAAVEAHEADLVVAYAFDRLWRTDALRAQLSALCREHRVQIYSCSEPREPVPPDRIQPGDVAQFIEALYGLTAEQENVARVRRQRVGMRARVARGLHTCSRAPYGYAMGPPGEPLRIVPAEAQWVRRVYEMRADGHGYRAIATYLNDLGVPGPNGGPWLYSTIRYMLRRPIYRGVVHWGDTVNEDALHEPIIDDPLWQRTQEANRARAWRDGGTVHALSGLVRCGVCGLGMGYQVSHRGRAPRLRCNRYSPASGNCKGAGTWSAREVEVFVRDAVRQALDDPQAWLAYRRREIDEGRIATEIAVLDRALSDAAKRYARWNELYERGGISADELLAHRERIAAQTQEARERRDALDAQRTDLAAAADRLADLSVALDVLDELSPPELRELYGHLIRAVILSKSPDGTRNLPRILWR